MSVIQVHSWQQDRVYYPVSDKAWYLPYMSVGYVSNRDIQVGESILAFTDCSKRMIWAVNQTYTITCNSESKKARVTQIWSEYLHELNYTELTYIADVYKKLFRQTSKHPIQEQFRQIWDYNHYDKWENNPLVFTIRYEVIE